MVLAVRQGELDADIQVDYTGLRSSGMSRRLGPLFKVQTVLGPLDPWRWGGSVKNTNLRHKNSQTSIGLEYAAAEAWNLL
jgi:hypothetical protein